MAGQKTITSTFNPPPPVPPPQLPFYVADSGGTPDVAGNYYENGTHDGYPAYEREDGAYWLYYESNGDDFQVAAILGEYPMLFKTDNADGFVNTYVAVVPSTGEFEVHEGIY